MGAFLGAWAATQLLKVIETYGLLLIASLGIGICMGLTIMADRWALGKVSKEEAAKMEAPLGKEGGFQLILRDRYLMLVATLTVLLNVVNTSGEFLLSKLVVQQSLAPGERCCPESVRWRVLRAFLRLGKPGRVVIADRSAVSSIFRYVGVRGSLFILPTIALTGYSLILLYPALYAVRILKIMENSTDYSVQNTARQALYLATSREAKYKAKAAIDTFFVRIGDVLLAGIVYVGTKMALSISGFASISVGLTIVWILVTIGIYREHKKRLPDVA